MAKNKYKEESYKEQVDSEEPIVPAEPEVSVKTSCPDCNVLIADGGKSGFRFPKPGLIDEKTVCATCDGSGFVSS